MMFVDSGGGGSIEISQSFGIAKPEGGGPGGGRCSAREQTLQETRAVFLSQSEAGWDG